MDLGLQKELLDRAMQEHRAGRLLQAREAYLQILQASPKNANVLNLLGALTFQLGNMHGGISLIREAIAINPHFPDYHFNLSQVLATAGQWSESVHALRQCLLLKPEYIPAWKALAALLGHIGGSDRVSAAHLCVELFERSPNFADRSAEDLERQFIHPVRTALGLDFRGACASWVTIGNALLLQGRLWEATAAFRKAIEDNPASSAAYDNLGTTLRELGQFDQSIQHHERAISLDPDHPSGHFNLALVLLLLGRFDRGFKEYEWRWKTDRFLQLRRSFPQPRWDGSALDGKRILLHAEQGFGDTIQFCRYCRMVKNRGGYIILACQPELVRLMQSLEGVDEVTDLQWPAFDVHCPLMSLAQVFQTTTETIPAAGSYLRANPARVAFWDARLGEQFSHRALRVGICWSGRRSHPYNSRRSINPGLLAPLAAMEGIQWVVLQKERDEREEVPFKAPHAADWTPELTHFAETAALMSNLDLIVSTDNGLAHLAGALGAPLWLLTQFAADWRWGPYDERSLWYPSAKLFRQARLSDWSAPIEEIRLALESFQRSRNENASGNLA